MKIIFLLLPIFIYASSIKIASYNVENLFDMQKSGLEYPDYIPNHHNWTEHIMQKKLNNISKVICEMDPDIIALQEVENDNILSKLQRRLERVGCRYRYRAITNSKNTPIHNALLSKIKIEKKRDLLIYRNSRHRAILEVDLDTNPKLMIFVNHWSSKKAPESARLHYAKALQKRVRNLPLGTEYILIGDFNSNYNEYQTMTKKLNDTNGITGINHLLKTIKNGKIVHWKDMKDNSKYHYNLWLELPSYERWSHNFYGKKDSLDSILLPNSMRNGAGWEYMDNTFNVFKPKYLFGYKGGIKRWSYKNSKHRGRGYSDHLPIYALFENKGKNNISNGGLWSSVLSIFSTDKSDTPTKHTNKITKNSIDDIYKMDTIRDNIELKNIKVILKRDKIAVIQQSINSRAILVYGCTDELNEGEAYDILVHRKKSYHGLDELVDITIISKIGDIDSTPYISLFNPKMLKNDTNINRVVKGVRGIIKGRNIVIDGKKLPIYFKNRVQKPKSGQHIRIKRVQIGYYKNHMQLVVWSRDDYEIKE